MIIVMVTVEIRHPWCCGVGLFSIHTRSLFVNKVRKKRKKKITRGSTQMRLKPQLLLLLLSLSLLLVVTVVLNDGSGLCLCLY